MNCKILFMLFFTICLFGCNGCDLVKNIVNNINGWNLSACISNYDVCWELYSDNRDRFDNGFIDGLERL